MSEYLAIPPTVYRGMQEAYRCHRRAEHTLAVELACKAFETVLSRRALTVFRALRRDHPLPNNGIRLLHTEFGVRVEIAREKFSAQESQAYLDYISTCLSALPRKTLVECLHVFLHRLAVRCLQGDWSLSCKRRMLRCLNILRQPLSGGLSEAGSLREPLVRMLGVLFHEPRVVVLAMLSEHAFYFEYNQAKRSEGASAKVSNSQRRFLNLEQKAYAAFVRRCPGSRVLLTIHMGDFIGAFGNLSTYAQEGRQAISLQRDRHVRFRHALNPSLQTTVLHHGESAMIEVVAALRAGNLTLAVLFDLREDFGATTEVEFFGCPARMVKGPALLAIAGHAPIVPFVTYERHGVDLIEMEEVVDTRPASDESLDMAATRITRQLALLAEKWIRKAPAQWKYLPSLPGYLRPEASHD